MTYREAVVHAAGMLDSAGIEYAENESRLLMEHVCQADLGFYLMHENEEIPAEREAVFFNLAEERCGHVPLQHLTGEQDFMGIPIKVCEDVLIPRQDTEILAEEAVRILRQEKEVFRVLDLCTGSGCIAIAIKSYCPDALVSGSDISAEALRIASGNAEANGSDIEWIESDMFSGIAGQFDMIVSNPPYIPTDILAKLMPEVRDHEPLKALDGGTDGLIFYRRILAGCSSCLVPGGYLLLEIVSDQADAVVDMMDRHGFEGIRVLPDLSGFDRVVSGRQGMHEVQ